MDVLEELNGRCNYFGNRFPKQNYCPLIQSLLSNVGTGDSLTLNSYLLLKLVLLFTRWFYLDI